MDCDFASIYAAFDVPLRRFVRARIGDADAAEDVLQDVYLRIHTHLGTLRDCAALPGWLFRIARHAVIDHHRARRPVQGSPESLAAPEDADEDSAARERARDRVRAHWRPRPGRRGGACSGSFWSSRSSATC